MRFRIVTKKIEKAIIWLENNKFKNVHPTENVTDTISADFTGNETAADVREKIQEVPGFQNHVWIS